MLFETSLVGVYPDMSYKHLYSFSWKSNYSGVWGGVELLGGRNLFDPGQGTGGVFDVQIRNSLEEVPLKIREFWAHLGAVDVPISPPDPEDFDGDGFTAEDGDCDELNPEIYPGADEFCNNKDNNCDGLIDEGYDADEDGFTTCEGDCDDAKINVNPSSQEICNKMDDDCNGQVDDVGYPCEYAIFGTISGVVSAGITVNLYKVTCGGDELIDTKMTNSEGDYLFINLENGEYKVIPEYGDYIFNPELNLVEIPQVEIQAYNYTANSLDSDNDGITDSTDNCPNNCNTQQLDADGDGIGDVCDLDPGCGGATCGGSQPDCETEC